MDDCEHRHTEPLSDPIDPARDSRDAVYCRDCRGDFLIVHEDGETWLEPL